MEQLSIFAFDRTFVGRQNSSSVCRRDSACSKMIFSRANEKVMFISNLSIGPWGAGQDEAIYVITSHAYLK